MRYILFALLSFSLMAVEEFPQPVATSISKPVQFALRGVNEGRGTIPVGATPQLESIWKIRSNWLGSTQSTRAIVRIQQPSGDELGRWFFPFADSPDPVPAQVQNDYTQWKNTQELAVDGKPLYTNPMRVEVASNIQHGTLMFSAVFNPHAPNEFSGPSLTYTPEAGFIGTDEAVLTYKDGFDVSYVSIRVQFTVSNTLPLVSLEASPSRIAPGGTVLFIPTTFDADGHPLALSYSYGDGSTGTEAFKTYSTPGVYTVTVTANDSFGESTASTQIEVVGDVARVPVPRFTTSDSVGFVGVPLGFDAFYSTDPQNSIVSYAWDFGDGSAAGSGQAISKTYTAAGSFIVTLTIVDGEGIQAKAVRVIEVLPASMIGTFNAGVEFSTIFDATKTNKDSVTVKATLNVGDTTVGEGTAIALEVAGQRFAATLDKKFRAVVNGAPKQTWKVLFGNRRQSSGEVTLQVTVKNCGVAAGFAQLGVMAGENPVEAEIPVRVEIGAKVFEVLTDGAFKFNRSGTRASGSGKTE